MQVVGTGGEYSNGGIILKNDKRIPQEDRKRSKIEQE